MMKRFYAHVLMLCVALFISAAPASAGTASRVQEQQFFEALEDVPLMPGLYEVLDDSLVFDKPQGRIVEALAASRDQSADAIRAYYAQSLPQMGWSVAGSDTYIRKGERLTLSLSAVQDLQILRITVAPR